MANLFKSEGAMYNDYRNLQTVRAKDWGLEELVYFYSCARVLCDTYSNLEIPRPDWLTDKRRELASAVKTAQADTMRRQVQEISAELEKMRPVDERRADLEARREALQTKIRG